MEERQHTWTDYFHAALNYCYERSDFLGKQIALAEQVGSTQATISRILKKKQTPKPEIMSALAQALGHDLVDFLSLGRNLMEGREPEVHQLGEQQPMEWTIRVPNEQTRDVLSRYADDYTGVPLYESGRLAAATGGASFIQHEQPSDVVVVYTPELGRRSGHRLVAMRVGGNSMEPTIPKESIVIADIDDKAYAKGRIYLVNSDPEENEVSVKRVSNWEKGFILVSDNHAYPPDPTPLDWDRLCVGRVIWMWRSVEGA